MGLEILLFSLLGFIIRIIEIVVVVAVIYYAIKWLQKHDKKRGR